MGSANDAVDLRIAGSAGVRHRLAIEREKLAWNTLSECRASGDAAQRSARFAQWLQANRDLRESQHSLTAESIDRAVAGMRECAALLSQHKSAGDGAMGAARQVRGPWLAPPRSAPAPHTGQLFRGRGAICWKVTGVTRDAIEPELFLVQIQSMGAEDDAVHDVYSDDWTLFCLVHALKPRVADPPPD